jgi:hypothetical protein
VERTLTLVSSDRLDLNIAGVDATIRAPDQLLRVIDRMLAHVSRETSGTHPALQVEAKCELDVWHVGGSSPSSMKVLGKGSALPQIAGAVVASLLQELAYYHDVNIWRAAVVAHGNNALVLGGDDWESCVTLAAHFHTRGWRLLGGDYAIVSTRTLSAIGFKKSLHANSSCLASFPTWYRPALEVSPWYSTSDLLAFYAIDPTIVSGDGQHTWADEAPIRAYLKVDGHTDEHPALETGDDFVLTGGVRRNDLTRSGISVAMLVRGSHGETCDFIERWFSTLPAYDRS